jgi:hypothetical protein
MGAAVVPHMRGGLGQRLPAVAMTSADIRAWRHRLARSRASFLVILDWTLGPESHINRAGQRAPSAIRSARQAERQATKPALCQVRLHVSVPGECLTLTLGN